MTGSDSQRPGERGDGVASEAPANTRQRVLLGLAAGWVIFVLVVALEPASWPRLLREGLDLAEVLRVMQVPFLVTGLALALWLRVGRTEGVTFAPWQLLVLHLAAVALAFAYPILQQPSLLGEVSALSAAISLLRILAVVVITLWMLSCVAYVSGRTLLAKLVGAEGHGGRLEGTAFALGIGHAIVSLGCLVLAWMGRLDGVGVLVLATALGALGARYFAEWIGLWRARIHIPAHTRPVVLLCGWVLFLTAVLNFTALLRPFPVGWDDLTTYVIHAQELARVGHFVPSDWAFPVELVYTLGFLAGSLPGAAGLGDMLALFVSYWGGLVGVLTLMALGRYVADTHVGVVAACLYYAMPMTVYLSSLDLKVDPTLFADLTLCLLAFLHWRERRDVAAEGPGTARAGWLDPGTAWLVLAGLLGAQAFLSKRTTALLGLALLVCFAVDLARMSATTRRRALRAAGISLTLSLLVLGPWMLTHAAQRGFALSGPADLFVGYDPAEHRPGSLLAAAGYDPGLLANATGIEEELGRYRGYDTGWGCARGSTLEWIAERDALAWYCPERWLPESAAVWPVWRHLALPWRVSLGRNLDDYHVTVGYLALALLPAAALFRVARRRKDPHGRHALLWAVALIQLAAWSIVAWGVPWYGIGIFGPIYVLLGLFVLDRGPLLRTAACALFAWVFVAQLAGQAALVERVTGTRFVVGAEDRAQSRDRLFPRARAIADQIAATPEVATGAHSVLRVGTVMPYFIESHRHWLRSDLLLDEFVLLDEQLGHDLAALAALLRRIGVRYVIYDTSTASIDRTPTGSLKRKDLRFRAFTREALDLVYRDPVRNVAFYELRSASSVVDDPVLEWAE